MNDDEVTHYRLQLERLQEMHEARQAREDLLRAQIEGLKAQAEFLRRQVWMLKYERGIQRA
jgi:multidrug resistance efflux pump